MSHKKLQIALEFMILYSLVLIIFLFLFALISAQRAQTLSSQVFSQEQLIAQSIAVQLDSALRAGNGYFASIPITGLIGSLNYQVSITKNGAVIVNATVGKQVMQAIAYSTVKNVVSNSTFSQNGLLSYYKLPIANGSISIQNSFGNICVDYACPALSNFPSNISLTAQVVRTVNLYGGYVNYCDCMNFGPTSFTISLWFKPVLDNNWRSFIIKRYGGGGTTGYSIVIDNFNHAYFGVEDNDIVHNSAYITSNQITSTNWHNLIVVRDYSSRYLRLYLDGVPSSPVPDSTSDLSTSAYLYFFGGGNVQPGEGELSNVQMYNIALSTQQAQQLYQAGISSPPISLNIAAWWPLNGNGNDYSGHGKNSVIVQGPLVYTTTVQLFAKVINQTGKPIANDLVGFMTTLGNFTTSPSFANYSNVNCIATAFLNQQGTNGKALVKATAYNGNSSVQQNLMGWWPLNDGQGNTASDLSGNNNNGAMKGGAYWSMPNYVSGFDGTSSYITTSYLQNSVTAYTLSAWIKSTSSGGVIVQDRLANSGSSLTLGFGPSPGCGFQSSGQVYFCDDANGVGIGVNSVVVVNDGNWHLLTGTWSASSGSEVLPSQFKIYIDGQSANTFGWSTGSAASPLTGAGGTLIGFHPVWNEYFSGSMSNVQAYTSVLSQSQIQSLYQEGIAGLPIPGTIAGWWPLNGDTNDYSGYGDNGTIFGNLNPLSTSSILNTNGNATSVLVANFNGLSSYLNLPPKAFGNYPFYTISTNSYQLTFTAWFQTTSNGVILGQTGGTVTPPTLVSGYVPALYIDNNGYVRASVFYHNSVSQITSARTYNDGNWHFLADSYNSGVETLYVDGVTLGSQTASEFGYSTTNTYSYYLGVNYAGGGWPSTNGGWFYFNGNLINVQVYNTSLNLQQIQQLYKGGKVGVPLSKNLTAWWILNGNANDYGWRGNSGTATNIIYVPQQSVTPYLLSSLSGYGVNFNGQGSYVSVSPLSDNSLRLTNQFTISAWVYVTGYPSTLDAIVSRLDYNSNGNGYEIGVWGPSASAYSIYASIANNQYAPNYYSNANVVPLNRWVDIAVTFNNNNGAIGFYLNGNSVGTATFPHNSIGVSSIASFNIGRRYTNQWLFQGSIADVQIYNTVLSAAQIKQLYQNAMPPSASAAIPMSWAP